MKDTKEAIITRTSECPTVDRWVDAADSQGTDEDILKVNNSELLIFTGRGENAKQMVFEM